MEGTCNGNKYIQGENTDKRSLSPYSCMTLICSVVGLPDRIVFTFIIITAASADITAGFFRLILQRLIAIAEIFSCANQKK